MLDEKMRQEFDIWPEQYGYAKCPVCNGLFPEEKFDGPTCFWCAIEGGLEGGDA